MPISMFDWPEQTHTSPTRMFLSVMVLPDEPLTVISSGWPTSSLASTTFQRPSSPALVVSGLAGNGDGDLFALVGPAPDGHGLAALQHHVVADHGRQLHRRGGNRSPTGNQHEAHRDSHEVPTTHGNLLRINWGMEWREVSRRVTTAASRIRAADGQMQAMSHDV